MKTKLIIFAAVLTLAFTGCDYADVETVNEQNTAEEPVKSMFVEVEHSGMWKVVYQRDTKVMYAVSGGGYSYGTFTLLVNPDGTPMIYEEDKYDSRNK